MKNTFILLILSAFILLSTNSVLFSVEPNPSWLKDITEEAGLNLAKGARISLVDINNDDYPDLIWGKGGINKNDLHIMLNVPNPNPNSDVKRVFIDWTDSSGINYNRKLDTNKHTADIAAVLDVNNDGNVDIITSIYYHRLQMYQGALDPGDKSEVYLGDGKGHFKLLENNGLYQLGLTNTTGLGFLDFNMDGKLDLFMGQWFKDYAIDLKQSSILLKGNGDGSFTKFTSSTIDNNAEPLYGTNVTDWDNDGWPDIITSPYCRSGGSLYTTFGSGQLFFDVAASVNYSSQFMQGDNGQNLCQWEAQPADFDCDGDMDLLQVQVHGGYNTNEGRTHIAVNLGPDSNFAYRWELDRIQRDAPAETHLGDQGGQWLDLDGDGWLDIAIGQMAYPDANTKGQERLYICRQNEKHYFDDISKLLDVYKYKEAHSVEPADFDLDGDQDIFFSRQHRDTTFKDTLIDGKLKKDTLIDVNMQISLLRNEIGNSNNWVSVKLEPPAGHNKAGIGARITVFAAGHNQIREIQAGLGHFSAQQPFIQNFSLGQRNRIDSIKIRWQMPGLPVTKIINPPINLIHKINDKGLDGYLTPWEGDKPVIAINTNAVFFGTVNAGNSSQNSFQIKNIGKKPLTITSIGLDDDMKGQLNILQINLPVTIPPESYITLNVSFNPTKRDTIYSHIVINSDAQNAPKKLVDLYGNGFKEEALFGISKSEVIFNNALKDSVYKERLFIRNLGEQMMLPTRFSIIFTDADTSDFSIDMEPKAVAPHDSIYFDIYFKPKEMRTYSCQVEIETNAYNIPIYKFNVTGICNGPTQQIAVKSGLLLFGTVEIGKSNSKTLSLQNTGIGPLVISEIYPEENLDNAYTIKSVSLPIILQNNESSDVTVEFSPVKAQSYKTRLVIVSNSIKDSVKYLSMNGTGGPVSVPENVLTDNIRIYPNPVSGNEIYISNVNNWEPGTQIRLFDIFGNTLIQTDVTGQSAVLKLNISTIPTGIYFIRAEGSNYNNTVKVEVIK